MLDNEKFQTWKTSSASELLWVYGKHGCGKSYLAARVVQDLTEDTERANKDRRNAKDIVALAYIYCNSLEATKVDPSKLIGSILNQLCLRLPMPEIEQSLESLYDRQIEAPTKQDMQRAIVSIMAMFSRTFIIIDGLDECHKLEDGQFEDLCEFVSSLAQPKAMSSVAKILVFSRPEYPTIKNTFREYLKIRVDAGLNKDDIKQFISNKVSGKGLHISKSRGLLEEVEDTLLSGADGMFLWVDLSVKTLKGPRTAKEIRAKLNNLPQGLDKVYEASMIRILEQEEFVRIRALKILLWTTNAKRPLSREELKEALAIEPDMTSLDDESDSQIHDDAGFAAECGDLVVLVNGYYNLLHSSLKDYLGKLPACGSHPLEEYGLLQKHAAKILGETCLTYLMFDSFRHGPMERHRSLRKLYEKNPFLKYAAMYWGRHVANVKGLDLLELTKNFLSSDGARELSMQIFLDLRHAAVFPSPRKTTPLHLLSIFNLVEIVRELPDAPSMRKDQDGYGRTPLDYALTEGRREMCVWILEDKTNLTPAAGSLHSHCAPVHMAATYDWSDIIERLIALNYNPEAKFGEEEQTPLHFAASEGSEAAMSALLKAKVNVNLTDNDGTTPLIVAADFNYPRLVALLLDAGADVNVHGWNRITPLHYAAINGELSIAKALFENGAEVDPVSSKACTPLHRAAENGHLEVVEFLIQKGADVDKRGPRGCTPLLLTCSLGFPACLERLIKENARIDARNDKMQTCFHLAAMHGHSDILEILVEKCSDPDHINSVDKHGDTPLHAAIWSGNITEAKFLLEHGALVDKLDNSSLSVLQVAAVVGQTEIAAMLIEQYGVDVRQNALFGSTPLHHAALYGRCDFIPLLLRAGAEPNFLDNELNTALHSAVKGDSLEFIKQLVEAVPTLDLAPRNKTGSTPLHFAAVGGNLEIVTFFLEHEVSSVQVENNAIFLPLHLAAWFGHLEAVKLLLNDDNINSPGCAGLTALHMASCNGHLHLVEFLLGKNADANKLDDFQQSPLLAALVAKHVDIATVLLDHRADPKIANKDGETALHGAACIGDEMMVRRLLAEKCDGLCTSVLGVTPFMYAVLSRKVEVVDAFLEYGFNGTAIPDELGATCIHIAAATGSIDMLNKLTAGNNKIALATNSIGCNALVFAATAGQVDMIEPLRDLGLSLNGTKGCLISPLRAAASAGYYDFVCRLIGLGADVNEQPGFGDWTPLLEATYSRMPSIAERLVEAGADPTCRNALGSSSLDYASQDELVWGKMGSARDRYSPIELQKRMPTLRNTVQKCVEMILALPEKQNRKTKVERLVFLLTLSSALFEMRSDQSYEHARMCFIELASPPESAQFGGLWMCNMCMESPISGNRYRCFSCISNCLCSICYSDYLKGSSTPKSAPEGLKVLQKLENDLKPIREIGKILVEHGGWVLNRCCESLVVIAEWVYKKLKAYEDWEKTYNETGRFDTYERPGQTFLKIIENARKLVNEIDKGEAGNTSKNQMSKIGEELAELYREHRPDKEMANFICSGHDYMEVRDKSTIEDVDKKCFGTDWKLTNEWLSALLEFYKDDEIEMEAAERAEETNLLMPERDSGVATNQVEETVLTDQMALLTLVLTDEPTEIAANDSATGAESSDYPESQTLPVVPSELGFTSITRSNTVLKVDYQHGLALDVKNDSTGNERQLRNETTSTIKLSTDTERVTSVPFGSSPNRRQLLDIGKELRRQMIEVLEAAKAKKRATQAREHIGGQRSGSSENASSERKAHESLTNEEQTKNRQDSQEENREEIKEKHALKQDERTTDRDAISGEDDDLAEYRLNRSLRWREAAWRFAQIILYGSVEYSLIDALVGSESDSGGLEIIPTVDEKEDHETSTEAEGERQHATEGKAAEHAGTKVQVSGLSLGESAMNQNEETVNKAGDKVEKAHEKVVSELRQTIDDTAISHSRYKAYRQASIDVLPPLPVSRKSTDLLMKFV